MYKNNYLTYAGYQFVLLAAPTRSGKGVGIVVPNCLNYSDSLVVLDIKGENFDITSGFRKACGQEVYLFSPYADDEKPIATTRWITSAAALPNGSATLMPSVRRFIRVKTTTTSFGVKMPKTSFAA